MPHAHVRRWFYGLDHDGDIIADDELAGIRTSTRAHLSELLEEPGIADDVVALERIAAYDMRLGAAVGDSHRQAQPSRQRAAGSGRAKRTAAKRARRRNRR
jgi:hypothetical protein